VVLFGQCKAEASWSLWLPFCKKIINHYKCVSVFLPWLYSTPNPILFTLLYCNLNPIWLHHIFPHILTNGTTGQKQIFIHKLYVVIFSTDFIRNICHSEKRILSDVFNKCSQVFMQSTRYYCQDLITLLHLLEGFSKNTQTSNFVKIRQELADFFPCRPTDITKLIVTFRNFANTPRNPINM